MVSNVTLKPLFPGLIKTPWDPPTWTLTLEVLKLDVFPLFVDDLVVVPLELDLLLGLLAVVGAVARDVDLACSSSSVVHDEALLDCGP